MNKSVIETIINHPIYTRSLKGQERIDGILGELKEENVITDSQLNDNIGKPLTLDTVDDVVKFVESL